MLLVSGLENKLWTKHPKGEIPAKLDLATIECDTLIPMDSCTNIVNFHAYGSEVLFRFVLPFCIYYPVSDKFLSGQK